MDRGGQLGTLRSRVNAGYVQLSGRKEITNPNLVSLSACCDGALTEMPVYDMIGIVAVRNDGDFQAMRARLADLLPHLNERDRRLAMGVEATSWGVGWNQRRAPSHRSVTVHDPLRHQGYRRRFHGTVRPSSPGAGRRS